MTPSWPIFGHDGAVQFLQRITQPHSPSAKQADTLRHAYLLLGTRQVGKSTLARLFAQSLLCTAPSTRPCGECRGCRLMLHGNHPDFRFFQPLDKNGEVDRIGGMLRVEQAAEIIHDVALRPMEGRYKIFLIQDLHTANDSFANKILKTLEEPPEHAIFILTALDRSRLLPTIVSRCQALELRPLAPQVIADALSQQWTVPEPQADLLSRLARGRLGWAIQQFNGTKQQEMRLTQLETLWSLAAATPAERLTAAEKLSTASSQELFELLELWTTWWRDVLLVQAASPDACCNIDQRVELERQAQMVSTKAVQQYLRTLARIEGYLHHTVNTRLALEVLVLQIPEIHTNANKLLV